MKKIYTSKMPTLTKLEKEQINDLMMQLKRLEKKFSKKKKPKPVDSKK